MDLECQCHFIRGPEPPEGEHKPMCVLHPRRLRAMKRMSVLLIANMRAAELRREALHGDKTVPFSIMHGAPTHSCAHLLSALEEQGYTIMPIPEGER